MPVLPNNLDATLLAMLDQIRAEYGRAEVIVASLRGVFAECGDPAPLLMDLQQVMQRVSASETRSAGAREAWMKLPRPGRSPEVESAIARQRTQLEALLMQVHEVEQLARDARNRLAPQLDSTIAASTGHAAYGRTLERAGRVR